MAFEIIVSALQAKFGDAVLKTSQFRDNCRVHVEPGGLLDVLTALKSEHGFDMLFELTAADYLKYPNATDRFGVMHGLMKTATVERLWIKTMLNEPDLTIASCYSLWRGADWMEREVYDMYGILFEGHPDLRRILMPEAFTGFPLRKDYPLRGRGERHNFPVLTRAEG